MEIDFSYTSVGSKLVICSTSVKILIAMSEPDLKYLQQMYSAETRKPVNVESMQRKFLN